jgi:hypothetical protein
MPSSRTVRPTLATSRLRHPDLDWIACRQFHHSSAVPSGQTVFVICLPRFQGRDERCRRLYGGPPIRGRKRPYSCCPAGRRRHQRGSSPVGGGTAPAAALGMSPRRRA